VSDHQERLEAKRKRLAGVLGALEELGDGASSEAIAELAGLSKRSTAATLGALSTAGRVKVTHRTVKKKDGRWFVVR